jgi:hypothetical protein
MGQSIIISYPLYILSSKQVYSPLNLSVLNSIQYECHFLFVCIHDNILNNKDSFHWPEMRLMNVI